MPSGVASTIALVPSSIWNCFRSHAGMTTWPLVVNHAASAFNVALMMNNLT
jgi:hypothetical protein